MLENFQNGYLLFHALLTVPVILILTYLQSDLGNIRNRRRWQNFVLLVVIAYIYTVPWDNYMISMETWWYGDVIWNRIMYAPVGEYLFFGIQTIIAGVYLYYLDFDPTPKDTDLGLKGRVTGFVFFMILAAVCLVLAFSGNDMFFYGGSILAWTLPVVAIQWLVGGNYLMRNWRLIVKSLVPPTIYMWIIDAYAIGVGMWTINPDMTIGIYFGPLPIEEMIFFLSANVMTVFGMVLYEWVLEVWKNGDGVFIQSEDGSISRLYHIFENPDTETSQN